MRKLIAAKRLEMPGAARPQPKDKMDFEPDIDSREDAKARRKTNAGISIHCFALFT